MSVEYKGQKYIMQKKGRGESSRLTLDLSRQGITDISEIKGLEILTNLHVLKLNYNNIVEIKGFKTLENLIQLELKHNQITKIKGLELLTDLQVLKIKKNEITEIKGLDTLKFLVKINFSHNRITKIEGLQNLTNLEDLNLENNEIEVIEGLDTLKNLHTLNLYGNRISQVESFQNKEKLSLFLFGGNPLYYRVKNTFGLANSQNLMQFNQMSDSERNSRAQITREERNRKQRLELKTQKGRIFFQKEKKWGSTRGLDNACCVIILIFGIIFLLIFLLTGINLFKFF